ncbi:phosphonate metabolism protein [Burkholderia sp. WAC0059]|uniref:DUF1045 domain-containing protein n=1 Tax=Burkholderia sp. WAC0059 TaxID=2066022 RepID=UPI000C7F3FA3|nr:DUF1045 domain-containing protein [Burkholderia sp. WAC0059]PLZ04184.1 phosphonate metabolism protein [Burkholderia sp. WAC0059]
MNAAAAEKRETPASAWSASSRFALYFAPSRGSAWWRAGCVWLGRDAESGETLESPQPAGLARPLAELTREPWRYGWHGTLVAPFHLASGVSPDDLLEVTRRWAAARAPFPVNVEAATLGRFVALRPADETGTAALRELASDALRMLGPLRAALSEADLARRLDTPLTERQRALLAEWGYPYVFDEFRFHMTLSGPLDDARERDLLRDEWATRRQPEGALPVESVALFVEPARGEPFVLWKRVTLGERREQHV